MKRWQSLLFILLTILLLNKSSVSQTNVFSDTIRKKTIIKIDPENPEHLENHFLKELSRGLGKNPKKASYSIDYQLTTSIVLEKADSSYWIMTDVLINEISGDIFFRDFTLENVLAPSIAIVNIKFTNSPGSYVDTVPVTDPDSGRNFPPPDPYQLTGIHYPFSFEIEQIKCNLKYDNSDLTHFNNQIRNRQDYYVSNAIIDTAFQLLFRLSDHDQPPLSSFSHIVELEHLLYHLENELFISDLNLEKHDPLKFLQKLDNLAYRYELARKNLEEKAGNAERGPGKIQLNKFYDDYIFQFLKYLNPSYHTDFYSRESFYQLGSVIYRKNQLADDASLFLKIAFNTRMDNYSGQILQTISDAIYDAWLEQADSSIFHQKYNDALVILQNAENFCHQSPYTFCDHNLFQKQAQAKYGLYDSFLTVATKALQSGNSQMAANFINRAYAYQKSNKEFIISDLKVKKLNDSLVAQNLLRAQNSYPELTEQYRDNDSIESLSKRNADSLLHIERRIKLLDLISSGRVRVWGNELHKAKRFRKESLLLAKSYFLDKDSTIQQALHGLDTLIRFKKCFDISLDYDSKIYVTKQAISDKNFIKADQVLQEVRYIVSDNPECNISDSLAITLLATYKPAIKYQKKSVEIENALEEKNYEKVFSLYDQVDELYDSQNLYLFGITHKPKETFITDNNDPGLLLFTLNASIMNGKGQEGFSILKRMRDIGMDKKKLKSQQQEIGELMAGVDHSKDKKTDPNVNLAGYTEGSTWFKIFNKTYMKKLKELSGKKNLFYF
ncbi:MAG: hypothetical protein KAT48_06200 [Bacteroidales bacterium]|nr:hypothetical protein [Bacteroidales bacterium]